MKTTKRKPLPAGGPKSSVITRLAPEALHRIESEMEKLTAAFIPQFQSQAGKSLRKDAELLSELVSREYETVAGECLPVCESPEEFETELWAGINQYVKYAVDKIPILTDSMREELDAGFTFFVMRANPWMSILKEDKTNWYTGACTGEALARAAAKWKTNAQSPATGLGFAKETRRRPTSAPRSSNTE
jgi:hypothetical protein